MDKKVNSNRELSLEFRNEIIERINNELNIRFYYVFNDLYSIKNGGIEVRRLKGGLDSNLLNRGDDFYENRFNEVKEFVENLSNDRFEVGFNKLIREFNDEIIDLNLSKEEIKVKNYRKVKTCVLKIKYKKDKLNN